MATEIYSCKDGQGLREGRLDYSSDVNTKDEAISDAERRCQKDSSIKRVAYYAVTEDGRFRNFYTHNNTNAKPAVKPRPASGAQKGVLRGKKTVMPQKPKSLGQRILEMLGLGGFR